MSGISGTKYLSTAIGMACTLTSLSNWRCSSRRDTKERRIDELLDRLCADDLLIVSELSRTGRSVIEIISIVNSLVKKHVRFVAIKEGLDVKGDHDIQTKVMITIFSLLAELERDLISERTRQALAAKRAQGVETSV